MLALVENANGNTNKAVCINNYYFASPITTRLVVNQVWKYPDDDASKVLVLLLNKWCSKNPEPLKAMEAHWRVTGTQDIQVEGLGDGAIAIDAGMRTLAWHAAANADKKAANCIIGKLRDDKFFIQIGQELRSLQKPSQKPSISRVTYSAVRDVCAYPNAPMQADLAPLPVIDLVGAARERLLAVRDLEECEKETDAATNEGCVERLYIERKDTISQAALLQNDTDLAAAEKKLDAIRAAAWRLPDGRLLFEDKDGKWHFEDGSLVSPELAATRIPPPKQ